MKICFYTDPHWSQDSSIIRSRGNKYSSRLENLIQSINWVEALAYHQGCMSIICGGDFFDSSHLNSEEISALKEISWAPLSHVFLTGNHETNVKSLQYCTSDLQEKIITIQSQRQEREGRKNIEKHEKSKDTSCKKNKCMV